MSDLIGQRLGQYEITAELGQGGMAIVYRARQVSVNREVAVKVIKADLANKSDFLARFEREAQTVAALSHPHILKLFDYGQQGDTIYLVSELLSGGSLEGQIKQGPLPLKRVDKLLNQIASALEYAHQRWIIHRDLKPANVLLDDDGNAILTDFGLAKMLLDNMRITQSGTMVGTPAYMSPEQWHGEQTTAQSDIYALGIMLFEMLGGKLPFDKDSTPGMMYAHLNEPPPAIDILRPELPPEVNAVIQRALAKVPEDRFESAMQMAETFHEIIHDSLRSTPSPAPTNTYKQPDVQPARPAQTAPFKTAAEPVQEAMPAPTITPSAVLHQQVNVPVWRIVLSISVITTLVMVTIILLVNRSGNVLATATPVTAVGTVQPVAPGEYMVLVAQTEQLGKQPREVTRFIVDDLTQTLETGIPFSKLRIRNYPQVITSAQDAQAIAKANNASVIVWGKTRDEATEFDIQIGAVTAFPYNKFTEDKLRSFADIRVRLTDPNTQSIAPQVLCVINVLQTADGNAYEEMRLLALLDQIKVTSAEVVGSGLAATMARTELIYLSDTRRFIQEMEAVVKLGGGNALPYIYRALAYQRLKMFDEARRDIDTAARLGPPGWTSPLYMQAADAYLAQNDFAKAVEVYDNIVKVRPDDWFAFQGRGLGYYFLGNYARARTDFEKAISLGPNANFSYVSATMLAMREGRFDDAKGLVNTVLTKFPDPALADRIFRAAYGDPNDTGFFLGPWFAAGTNLLLGQYDSTLKDVQLAIKLAPKLADLYVIEGMAYCNLGKNAEAEQSYTKGLDLDPDYTLIYLLRAEVRLKQGNRLTALADTKRAQESKLGPEFAAAIAAGLKGEVTCQNFFTHK